MGNVSEYLGAKLSNLSESDKAKYKLSGGAKVTDVDPNGRFGYQGFEKGFVITKIDDNPVSNAKEAAEMLTNRKGRVKLDGIDADGARVRMVL